MDFPAHSSLELGDYRTVHGARSIIRLCALLHHLQTPGSSLPALTVQHGTESRQLGKEQARKDEAPLQEKEVNQLADEQSEEIKAMVYMHQA